MFFIENGRALLHKKNYAAIWHVMYKCYGIYIGIYLSIIPHNTAPFSKKQNLWTLKWMYQAYIFKQILANSSYHITLIITLQYMQEFYLYFLLQKNWKDLIYNILLLLIYADMLLKFYFIQMVNMYSISKSKTTLVL